MHHVNDNKTFRHRFRGNIAMISKLCHCSNPSTPLEESRCKLEISSKVASRSMGRDRDANHEVSDRDGDRDADFTQPSSTHCPGRRAELGVWVLGVVQSFFVPMYQCLGWDSSLSLS